MIGNVKYVNWIDILALAIIIRIVSIGMKKGFVLECFKIGGVFCAVFITFHYFTEMARFLSGYAKMDAARLEVLTFGLLWGLVILIFKFIREGWMMLLKVEVHPILDGWGALLISLLRGILLCALTISFLYTSNVKFMKDDIMRSISGSYLLRISPQVYKLCYSGFVGKFFPEEKLNTKVVAPEKSDSSRRK